MFGGEHALVSGDGDENVADFRRFGHGHHAETIHHRFNGARGINFRDDHVRAQPLGAHGHAASAPAVSGDYHAQSGQQQIRRANNSVERGLPRAVAIIEEMLRLRVVHRDHGIFQRAVLGHRAQTNHAGGGFFGAADHVLAPDRCAWSEAA